MRRGPTDFSPSPFAGEGRGEGKTCPLSTLCPIPSRRHVRAACANEKEILHFVQNDNGEGQNDYGEGDDYGEGMTTGEGDDFGRGDDYRGDMTIEVLSF